MNRVLIRMNHGLGNDFVMGRKKEVCVSSKGVCHQVFLSFRGGIFGFFLLNVNGFCAFFAFFAFLLWCFFEWVFAYEAFWLGTFGLLMVAVGSGLNMAGSRKRYEEKMFFLRKAGMLLVL